MTIMLLSCHCIITMFVVMNAGSSALPRATATKVVAEVAHSFFAAAKSLEAEEIGLGHVTLTLLPDEPSVQEEGRCIKALQELQDWGINLLPAQYYQVGGQRMASRDTSGQLCATVHFCSAL